MLFKSKMEEFATAEIKNIESMSMEISSHLDLRKSMKFAAE
jgi:hypothetical protein